ncbi:MAG: Dabb family protein [Acidimicrobiia bacterium]|jgi:hypothetical protein
MSRFRHLVILRLKEGVTDSQREGLLAEFARMPEVMDYIRRYEFGFDLGNLGPRNPDFGLVADFDSEEDWRRYSVNADHRSLLEKVKEVAESTIRVQYLVD